MKLSVVALDYDGTVARDDVLDPSVRDAIAAARTQGIVVLLVTGRILDELRRVAGDLHFVDGVVAENGAVIHFPDSGRTSALAPPLPETFMPNCAVAECPLPLASAWSTPTPTRRRACSTSFGPSSCLWCSSSTVARDDAPQGVSKATGLHVALETLRLSARNTVAIGDAENDHELLRLAEVGVAVPGAARHCRRPQTSF